MKNQSCTSTPWLGKLFHFRPSEYTEVGYFFVLFFVLGFTLSISRIIADVLLLSHFGASVLPYMYLFIGLLTVPILYAYSWYLTYKLAESLLLRLTSLLAALSVIVWFVMVTNKSVHVYSAFYVLNELITGVLLMHIFHYAKKNIYYKNESKILPLVITGIPVGGMLGGGVVLWLSSTVGVEQFVLVWGGLFALLFFMILSYHKSNGQTPENQRFFTQPVYRHKMPDEIWKGVTYLRKSSLYLQLVLGIVAAIVATYILHFLLSHYYVERFTTEENLVTFFAWLIMSTSALAFLLQIVAASRLMSPLGLRVTNLLPALALILGYAILHGIFVLASAVFASIVKDLSNIVVRTPSYHPFFQSIPHAMQERCRLAIRIIIIPAALILTGCLLLIFNHDFATYVYLSLGLVAALFYLWANIRSNRSYYQGLATQADDQRFAGLTYRGIKPRENTLIERLNRGLDSGIRFIILENAERLLFWFPKMAFDVIVNRLPTYSENVQISLLALLAEKTHTLKKSLNPVMTQRLEFINQKLWELHGKTDSYDHQCRIMHILYLNNDHAVRELSVELDESTHPCKSGLYLHQLLDKQSRQVSDSVDQYFRVLMSSGDEVQITEALLVAKTYPDYPWEPEHLLLALQSARESNRYDALNLLGRRLKDLDDITDIQKEVFLAASKEGSQRVLIMSIEVIGAVKNDYSCQYLFQLLENCLRSEAREKALDRWLDLGGNPEYLKHYVSYSKGYYRAHKTIILQGRSIFDQYALLCIVDNKLAEAKNLYEILQCLSFYKVASDQTSPVELSDRAQMALSREVYARYAHQQMVVVDGLTSYEQFTLMVLNERLQQLTILALKGLLSIDNKPVVETLLSAIRSKDARFMESVREQIQLLHREKYKRPFYRLMSMIIAPDEQHYTNSNVASEGLFTHQELIKKNQQAIDNWTQYHGDKWVKQTLSAKGDSNMIDLIDRITLLKKMDIFSEIYTEDMKSIAEALEEDYFTAGDYVFKKGDPSDCSYIISSGKVGISVDMEIATTGPLVTLGEGGYFGEMGVLDGHPRAATAYVLEDTKLLCISRKRFGVIIQHHPEIAISILSRMNSIIREQNRQIYND